MAISFALDSNYIMSKDILNDDKKSCKKIGPVGIGKRAIYLNSFYIDRMWYLPWEDVERVFKRIAMSAGGFTGKGAFGSMSYLVVLMKNGKEKQCLFKHEEDVDNVLSYIKSEHPQIPIYSKKAEEKLRQAKESTEKRYLEELPKESISAISKLEKAKTYLEKNEQLSQRLSITAGKARVQQNVPTSSRIIGIGMLGISVVLIAFGIPSVMNGIQYGPYLLLFGFAFLLFSLTGNLVPIGSNSKKFIEREWTNAVDDLEEYIDRSPDFPVPARYAHPIVLERMIRIIREGRATSINEALEEEKKDLKALNSSVRVSQEEYDEVTTIKPMFLISDYK